MDGRFYGIRNSTDILVCVGIRSSEDVFWNRVSRVCVGIHSSEDMV
jgi:hypothetical protein